MIFVQGLKKSLKKWRHVRGHTSKKGLAQDWWMSQNEKVYAAGKTFMRKCLECKSTALFHYGTKK